MSSSSCSTAASSISGGRWTRTATCSISSCSRGGIVARPHGNSHVDYVEKDEWTLEDLCRHLRFWKGALRLDTDYVRGRMMKTYVRVWPTGVVEIETINRHQMATRWAEALKGKKHLHLVTADTRPSP